MGKKRWIAKVNEHDRIYALYPSLRQASIENWLNTSYLLRCLRKYTPDDNGFYYRYCDSVEAILTRLEFEQVLD